MKMNSRIKHVSTALSEKTVENDFADMKNEVGQHIITVPPKKSVSCVDFSISTLHLQPL